MDDAGLAIIIENFDSQPSRTFTSQRKNRIQHCGNRTFANAGDWFKTWYVSSLPGWKQCVARSEVVALALALICARNLVLIVDSDYAANVLHFVKSKTIEELNSHNKLKNFDLYHVMHAAWHLWPARNFELIITKSHDVENSSSLLDRYYKVGNAFADYAAKMVPNMQAWSNFNKHVVPLGDIWTR